MTKIGERTDCIFCIVEGTVTIIDGTLEMVDETPTLIESQRSTVTASKETPLFLCEDALINAKPMAQSIRCESECLCYVLRDATLQLLLGTNDLSILGQGRKVVVDMDV